VAVTVPSYAAATPAVSFTKIQFNSPGSDTRSNTSLNAEWVRMTNNTRSAIQLKSWTVRDKAGHVYTFKTSYSLGAGKRVYLHTFSDEGLLAVDAATGKKAWRASFADNGPIEFTLGGGVVYGWRADGYPLAAFATSTGTPIRLAADINRFQSAPMVANGRLYGRTGSTLTSFAP